MRFLLYGELENKRKAMGRVGTGIEAVEAASHLLAWGLAPPACASSRRQVVQ